jgi:ankyrin repeat protein
VNKIIARESIKDRRVISFQHWVAKLKLKHWGLNKRCFIEIPKHGQRLVLLFLVEQYDEKSVSNNAVINLISIFVNQGCSLNEHDPKVGITPFHSAIMLSSNTLLIEFLLENGADIEVKIQRVSKAQGKNALEWAKMLLEIKENKKIPTNNIKDIIFLLNEKQSSN